MRTSTGPSKRKPIIGLTGGIGAGKTLVAQLFESLGAQGIDFDQLAHTELDDPEVRSVLHGWWGPSAFRDDGRANRAVIAAIVFQDAAQLARLEGVLYPRLRRRAELLIAEALADPSVTAVVLDAAKLFEAGLDSICNTIVFVEADPVVRLGRVARHRGWTKEEWTRRENLQNPLDKKKASADHVVINQSGIEDVRAQVERLFASVLASFA